MKGLRRGRMGNIKRKRLTFILREGGSALEKVTALKQGGENSRKPTS